MNRLLSLIPFVLCNLMAPDAGSGEGGAGGGEQEPAVPTEEPKPTGDTVEAKLQSAAGFITSLFKQLTSKAAALVIANGEVTKLQSQFAAADTEANRLKGELATVTTNRDTEKTRADSEKARADRSEGNVGRLEKLCQLKGIDPNGVVPPAQTPAGDSTPSGKYEKYQSLKEEEKAGKVKAGTAFAYWQANKEEIDKHAASLRKD